MDQPTHPGNRSIAVGLMLTGALVGGLSFPTPSAAAATKPTFTSTYVSIKQADCKQQKKSKNAGFVTFACGSVKGWQVLLEYEEGITSVSLTRGGSVKDTGAADYTNGDLTTGDRLEVRLKNGAIYSTVVRLNEYSGDKVVKSTLLVSNMAGTSPGSTCAVAVIEPGPTQSADARKAADRATLLPCLTT
jgi:hypothetical protein